MQDDTWSWVGEDGVEHHGSESQLAAALSAQRLPAYTLVTRRSWRDWLPAMAVADLQRALPVTSRDIVRSPTLRQNEPKLPPPMHEYPGLRLRHHGLQHGATPAPSRPRSSIPSSPHLELARYANDEFDEPTVQIDADELERALNESRVDDAPVATPRSGIHDESPVQAAPLAHHDVKRRALAQRLAHKMPTYPGYATAGQGAVTPHGAATQGAAPQGVATPPPPPPFPPAAFPVHGSAPPPLPPSSPVHINAPHTNAPHTNAPLTPPSVPSARLPVAPLGGDPINTPPPPPIFPQPIFPQPSAEAAATFGTNEPTLTSRIGGSHGETHAGSRKWWLGLVAIAGILAGAAWFLMQQAAPDPDASAAPLPTATAPVKLPAPDSETQAPPRCSVEQQVRLSEFAHAQVRPTFTFAGPSKVALGFAQTGRVAAGIVVNLDSLAVDRVYSDNQTSPLWSVTPVTVDGEVKYRVSRAASTLRSTVTLATQPPLFFGLNREGLAVRGDADPIDRTVWKTEWDTISLPDVAAFDGGASLVALRAGGERGKILIGKIAANGHALGELTTLATGTVRLEAPSLLVTTEQVIVTYAAGDKPVRDKVFIAVSDRSSLPSSPKPVMQGDHGILAPTLAQVGGAFALQYTRGIAGKQEVIATVLDRTLTPHSEPLVISPAGRDAYEGVIFNQEGALLSVYFVRQEFGHELWASKLACK